VKKVKWGVKNHSVLLALQIIADACSNIVYVQLLFMVTVCLSFTYVAFRRYVNIIYWIATAIDLHFR